MMIHDAVAKLATLIPALKANDAQFASDLIGSFKKYGSLTPKQEPWIERLIARAEAPKAPVAEAVQVGDFGGVLALFAKAKQHLKFPKIRLSLNGVALVLSVNGPKSKAPGSISVSGEGEYPNRAYYGRVTPEGAFQPFKQGLPGLVELLQALASNPARVAKEHGKLTGHCCFCNRELGLGKEKRSVLVGFGPDCAEHYGLKAEWLAAAEKAEAKASVAVPATSGHVISVNGQVFDLGEGDQSVVVPMPTVTLTEDAGEWDDATQELAHPPAPVVAEAWPSTAVCFFCEQATEKAKTLHGYVVCPTCVAQLQA